MVQVFAVCARLLALVSPFQSAELVESAAKPVGERLPSDWLFSEANRCTRRETVKEPVAVASMISPIFCVISHDIVSPPPLPTAPFDINLDQKWLY